MGVPHIAENLTLASPIEDLIEFAKDIINALPNGTTITIDIPLTEESLLEVKLTKKEVIP